MAIYLSIYLFIYLSIYLSIYHLLCLVVGFRPRFQCLVLPPVQLPCQKINQGTDVLTRNCLPPLLALCVLIHLYTKLIILTGSKNDQKIKITVASWQSAFSIHPFDCEYTNILIVLTACIWRERVCEKVALVVKWASRYY